MNRNFLAMTVLLLLAVVAFASHAFAGAAKTKPSKKQLVDRGRYLVLIGGCNDCHTPGYMENNGKVQEAQWLTGSPIGWSGPWGTTYAPNLRLLVAKLKGDQWLKLTRTLQARPPMPWYDLRQMTDSDLRAIGAYIRYMGEAGGSVPEYLPPGKEPSPPYMDFKPLQQ